MLRKGEMAPPSDQQYVNIINLQIKIVDARTDLIKQLMHSLAPVDESITYFIKTEAQNIPIEIPGFVPVTPAGKQICERYRTSLLIYSALFKRLRTLYSL
jgi:hypothetical protein